MKQKKETTFSFAALAMIACFAFIMIPSAVLGTKIHVMFLLSWLIGFGLCMSLGYSYKELQSGMIKFIPKCIVPVLLILTIGAVIGAWCSSGTIAYITYLGLEIINPRFFLATAFIVTLICACFTGTSFGTCGTVGVALMGVALGMDMDPLWAASAILCAAVIGDGISPLSDTPNVIAGAAEVDMFESVKFQLPMTIPVALLSFLFYLIMGATGGAQAADTTAISELCDAIAGSYNLGIHCLLPIIVVFALLIFKIPAIPALLLGSLTALGVACFAQGETFQGVINAMWNGFTLESDNAMVSRLFSRGGVSSMTGTCVLIIFSFGLFGILNEAKVLDTLVKPLGGVVKNRVSGAICVVILGFLANLSGSASFSEVFTGNIMSPVYEKAGLNKLDLTRAATVGCLVFSMYIPFVVMPATVTASLGVDPVQMIPYYISMPIYLVVLLLVTGLNLDKKLLAKKQGAVSKLPSA